jgi:hypothetical protein
MTELETAVYDVLKASAGPMQLKDIYAKVKNTVPHLCDDSKIPCPYCKQNHPLW